MSQTKSSLAVASDRLEVEERIQDWLLAAICDLLGVEAGDIDPREPFATYGLNSIAAVSLAGDLETWLGLDLPATIAWEYPSIEKLAAHLADQVRAEP